MKIHNNKRALFLSFLAVATLATHMNTYSVWWNPFTWFETQETNPTVAGKDIYKTTTVCPRSAITQKTDTKVLAHAQPKPGALATALAATQAPSAKIDNSDQDNCPPRQQLCVGNLGDNNNATFCATGDCPYGTAPVLNKPVIK